MVDFQRCFIENMRHYRNIKGISQAQLAELCNVSNGTIGNIECGITKPSFDMILKIAEKLDIQPELLFHISEQVEFIQERKSNCLSKAQIRQLKKIISSAIDAAIDNLAN
nr:helix-turn-helix transcriptional regulator [Treponema sp.]